VTVAIGVAGILLSATATAAAQDVSVNFGQGNGPTERVIQMIALLTVLSLAPSILVMMTSFTRIVVFCRCFARRSEPRALPRSRTPKT
jgi:flagellar biosynthetic protein FliP